MEAREKLARIAGIVLNYPGLKLEAEGEELMTWQVSASRLATLWSGSGADRGFRMKLAWDRRPLVEDVRMQVRFETLDGRAFTTLMTPGSVDQPRYRWLKKEKTPCVYR
jgi:hypothetical protein